MQNFLLGVLVHLPERAESEGSSSTTFGVPSPLTAFQGAGTHDGFARSQTRALGLFIPNHGAFNEMKLVVYFPPVKKP